MPRPDVARFGWLPVSVAAVALAVAGAATAAREPTVIMVTAGKPSEYNFVLSRKSVERGTVIFRITNLGKKPHSFGINGRTSKILRPHQSTTLRVVFKKAQRYVYSDTCLENPNAAEQQEQGAGPAPAPSCAGGILTVI